MPHAVSPVFGPALTGVREARQWAAETTSGWGLDGERDTLLLVVSELATNAMLHAVSTARVILDYDPADGVLEVAVEDTELLESSTAPGALDVGHQYVAERDPERLDGGRGLLIIHALAQQWGVRATETGKQVWLQLPVTPVLHDPVRLAAVDRLLAVGIESQVLVGLVELARELLGARHAQASLRSDVDVIAAESGTNADRSPMQRRQLTDLTLATGLGVLPDVGADDRVSGVDDSVGSYLGVPLVVGELAVGVLAVDDSYPRPWTPNDVGVLERSAKVLVLAGDFGWDDVGTWAALRRVRQCDAAGNTFHGTVHALAATGNVVHSEGNVVVLYGVSDLVVVSRDGITLVTTVEKASDLKTLIDSLPPAVRALT